jgi:AbiTii
LPSYRGPFAAEVRGSLSGPFGSGFQNAPIPPSAFPEELRKGALFHASFLQPIAELEALANTRKELRNDWPADALALAQHLIQTGETSLNRSYVLNYAYRPISPAMIAGIVDNVRSRILNFALSLEEIDPSAGTSDGSAISPENVGQIFTTHIYGSATNIAIGSSNVEQSAILPSRGDEDGLIRALELVGVPATDLEELRAALAADREEAGGTDPPEPGPRVSNWWTRASLKTGSVVGKVGISAAGGLAGRALAAYFGLG